jgi:hypothetical protein
MPRWIGLSLVCAACASPPAERPRAATPYDVAVAGALTANELAHHETEQKVYGWHLEIVGDRARYFACTAEDACTSRPVEISARSLLATKVVNRTRPTREDGSSGDEVDVVLLTLSRDVETTRGGAASDARGLVVR